MLRTNQLELSIKNCLDSLSGQYEITVATLPNKANQVYESIKEKNVIKIIIPVVTGEKPTSNQLIRYEVLIQISMSERINDSDRIPSIDKVKDEIIGLIQNDLDTYICVNSHWFANYRLIPAQGGLWSAEVIYYVEKYL